MKIAIILNGISKRKKKFYKKILPALTSKFSVEVFETQFSNHARQLAAEAVAKNFDTIISAGGDGTLNQVVNGMMSEAHQHPLPALGLLPLGSGNDFAGAIKLSDNPDHLIELLIQNQPKPTDIGKVICRNKEDQSIEHYFINVCSLGMGPATVLQMEKSPSWLSANLRYLTSVIVTFFTQTPEKVELKTSGLTWKGKARAIAIANGQSFGSKIYIAPNAKPDDGLFDIFLAADLPLFKFLLYLQKIKSKKKISDPKIIYSSTSHAALSSSNKTMLEAEGELIGFLPATVNVMPEQIRFFR